MHAAPDIHLHIERLILDGLPFADADAATLRSTLESELAALLTGSLSTAPDYSLVTDKLSTTTIPFQSKPAAFGQAIATNLHGTLTEALA